MLDDEAEHIHRELENVRHIEARRNICDGVDQR